MQGNFATNADGTVAKDANGNPEAAASGAKGVANASGTSLRIGIGASSAAAHSDSHDDIAYASHIRSAGDVTIAATDGDLNVIGSQINGQNVALAASHNLNLLSQAEEQTQSNHSANARGEIGFSMGSQTGFYATADGGKGIGHGNGTTFANTSVSAHDTLSLISGNDTSIIGAQAKGNTVLASIGGNLNVASQQTTDDYASHYWQAGGTYVYGSGSEVHAAAGMVDSNYKSVNQISGISAGDGGYQIHVGGNTDLEGAVIASSADPSKNLLSTGTLSYSDIENKADYTALSASVSIGRGSYGSGGSIGIPQHDSEHSTTRAGVAQGTIDVRNGTSDLSGLDRNPDIDATGLKTIFDQDKVQERQELGQVAGQVGMRAAGDLAQYMATHASSDQEQQSWLDGGTNKVLLHGLVGAATAALGGGNALQGALGASASEVASAKMQEYLWSQDIDPNSNKGKALMALASTAVGGVVGGGAGGSTALAGEQYNRQLHSAEIDWIRGHAEDFARQQCGCKPRVDQIEAATTQLSQQAARQTDVLWSAALVGNDSTAQQYLASARTTFTNELGNAQQLFTVVGNQFLQPLMYLTEAGANRTYYQKYVQPGTGNINTGLQFLLLQAGVHASLNQGQVAWSLAKGMFEGVGETILHPIDTFNAAGQGLGTSSAYAFNYGSINNQLRAVYGQNVNAAASALATLNSALTVGSAIGAGKGVATAIERAAKLAAVGVANRAVLLAVKNARQEAIDSALVANNFYRDGSPLLFPLELKTSSGLVIAANPDKTTTVLGIF